jgi:hypothetical protein
MDLVSPEYKRGVVRLRGDGVLDAFGFGGQNASLALSAE